jgi:peptidoglycan/xylan/chitin deacetylase (PgdA/CDA1 family)
VEDYFQVSAFARYIRREDWDARECRVERNVERILQLLAERDVKATFFTLGWVASATRRSCAHCVAGGHELASHGYGHERASDSARRPSAQDVTREEAAGRHHGRGRARAIARRAFPSAPATSGPLTR